ncbi:hypothetical protein LZ016_13030 [Sphingomonas sp. SM33]|uniref:DUF4034 domain-containing protein n=1 Tax=Sphingomonas telluris TaxID=2907998 RepID=A0ABS9VPY2_9SPHN|nr:hypothetical protein [Sphingomonas telluris]MCH8617018.1 hypothetical protein [Sphingomonas telluris]
MRFLILLGSFLLGFAWRHSDELHAMVVGTPQETPEERAEIMQIPAVSSANELESRKAFMEEVHRAIVDRDFSWLSAREFSLRQGGNRTDDGVWKLELFYNSMWWLGNMNTPDCTDPAAEFLAEWRIASPSSPAPFIVSAQRLLDKGWCYRGSGYAKNVNISAWKPFSEYVDAAHEMLARHKDVASQDPQYYAVMASIYVAQGRSEGDFQNLMDEAVAKEPYYYPLYQEAFRYYEPQWFGSYKDEEAVAQFAADQTQAKERTSAFARVYWHAMSCGCMPPTVVINKKALRRAMHDLVELYPTAWNVSHMARLACQIEDGELANSYFEALPAGDEGKAGWSDWGGIDVPQWQACRTSAGLPANA